MQPEKSLDALMIYNPLSGRKSQHRQFASLLHGLRDIGYRVRLHNTTDAEKTGMCIEEACANGWDAVFVAGGDGTVNRAIQTLAAQKHRPHFGVFPFGTSNEFATFLGMPADIGQSLSVIEKQYTKPVDIGQFGDHYFVNIAAAGWLTDITYKTPPRLKSWMGEFAYYLFFMKELWRKTPETISIKTSPERTLTDVLLFMIMNGKSVGPFERLVPEAAIDDGYFHLIACQKGNRLQLLYSLMSLMFNVSNQGGGAPPLISKVKIQSTVVNVRSPNVALNVDGEQAEFTDGQFHVLPGHIRVFAPEKSVT